MGRDSALHQSFHWAQSGPFCEQHRMKTAESGLGTEPIKLAKRLPEPVAWMLVPVCAICGIVAAGFGAWIISYIVHGQLFEDFDVNPIFRALPPHVLEPLLCAAIAPWAAIRLGCWIAPKYQMMTAIAIATAFLTAFAVLMIVAHTAGWVVTTGTGWFWRFFVSAAAVLSAMGGIDHERRRERERKRTDAPSATYRMGSAEKRAFEEIRCASIAGNREAQFDLYRCLLKGNGTSQNHEEAHNWLRKSAESGLAKAQLLLGIALIDGSRLTKNEAEGFGWIEKAANQGVVAAALVASDEYKKRGDHANAVRMLKCAALMGYPEALYEIAAGIELEGLCKEAKVESYKWLRWAKVECFSFEGRFGGKWEALINSMSRQEIEDGEQAYAQLIRGKIERI